VSELYVITMEAGIKASGVGAEVEEALMMGDACNLLSIQSPLLKILWLREGDCDD